MIQNKKNKIYIQLFIFTLLYLGILNFIAINFIFFSYFGILIMTMYLKQKELKKNLKYCPFFLKRKKFLNFTSILLIIFIYFLIINLNLNGIGIAYSMDVDMLLNETPLDVPQIQCEIQNTSMNNRYLFLQGRNYTVPTTVYNLDTVGEIIDTYLEEFNKVNNNGIKAAISGPRSQQLFTRAQLGNPNSFFRFNRTLSIEYSENAALDIDSTLLFFQDHLQSSVNELLRLLNRCDYFSTRVSISIIDKVFENINKMVENREEVLESLIFNDKLNKKFPESLDQLKFLKFEKESNIVFKKIAFKYFEKKLEKQQSLINMLREMDEDQKSE